MIHSDPVISSFLCVRWWAWLFAMKEHVVRLSTLCTSNSMKSSKSAECVCSVVLSTLSHWLYDISLSISNFVNLFLMNFSRTGYPGQFLQRCTMHSRFVVLYTTIAIKSLYVMSNFRTSRLLSSDSSAFHFNWVFTAEQKQSTSTLVFWWRVQTRTESVPDNYTVMHHLGQSLQNFERPILWSGHLSLYTT